MKKFRVSAVLIAAVILFEYALLPVDAATISDNTVIDSSIESELPENAGMTTETVSDNDFTPVRDALSDILKEKPIYALIYNADFYTLYDEPGNKGNAVGRAPSGTQVFIQDVELSESKEIYYLVTCGIKGTTVTGYVENGFLVSEDKDFCEWKETTLKPVVGERMLAEASNVDSVYANFPSGYHQKLLALAAAHPNWTFVAHNTGMDWYDAVTAERVGNRSLVYKTVIDSWKSKDAGDYDYSTGSYIPKSGPNWLRASQEAVDFCMNPLNYLDETHIFAFEQLTYDANVHNASGVNAIIRNSWMYNRALEDSSSGYYCDVFVLVGALTGVSPYHLASRVLQEQGTSGNATLISGYGGVYNYFNVQASGSTAAEILQNGTAYAQSQGWTTRYASIYGGAERLGANYITKGQDTLYLQKFDVDNSYYGMYNHQYMQNIQAPTTESNSVYRAYSDAGALSNNFVFKIPVYNNMPSNGEYNPGVVENPTSEEFIRQIYSVILEREPDEEGLKYWMNQLKAGETAADVVGDFFNSREMKNKNLSNKDYLKYAYRAILGREPDADGEKYWLSELDQGATERWLISEFVVSTEFTQLCARFGIVRGNLTGLQHADKSAGVTKFVTFIYKNVLKRSPDSDGLNYWAGEMVEHNMTASKLVEQFASSPEFASANISNEEYVERLYETVLGRKSDESGKGYWVSRMNTAGYSRHDVLREFTRSAEFSKICSSYGVTVGEI